MRKGDQFKVVIAGGGVAAVEGMLALRDLVKGQMDLELLAPNEELTLPALAVGEPFGIAAPPALPLADICGDVRAVHRRDGLRGIDPDARTAHTQSGAQLPSLSCTRSRKS